MPYNQCAMISLESITQSLTLKKPKLMCLGITESGVLGSYVRGEQKANSDLDILIDIDRPAKIDLLGLINLEQELSDDLGVPVDLVLKSELRPSIGKKILSEVVYL